MGGVYIIITLLCLCINYDLAETRHDDKMISIFNVVKFKNDVCAGSGNQNGTCYTTEECSNRGGTASGSCAEGYGVCCVVSLDCGKTSSENCTYLVQDATTAPDDTCCEYTLCPASSNICRIKLDLTTFVIAGPSTASDAALASNNQGDCTTDTFSITGGSGGSPVICGTNTGQHLFVDSDGSTCSKATFTFGGGSTSRKYDIKILQYDCRNRDMGGPTGCLQYFTATTGTIASFNYPIGATTIAAPTTFPHLSNQAYTMCIRRASGYCAICYIPSITTAMPASFGLSVASIASMAEGGTNCLTDYIEILGGVGAVTTPAAITASAIALSMIGTPTLTAGAVINGNDRFCGAALGGDITIGASVISESVCTGTTPFQVRVHFDAGEAVMEGDPATNIPAGIIGFSLNYALQKCT